MRTFGLFAWMITLLNTIFLPITASQNTAIIVSDPVLVGAGDIANCSTPGDEATANLLDNIAGTVFTTGDNVYSDGTAAEFANCYEPSWGRHKARTRPAPGNHDYHTPGASAYYNYFGANAGDPHKGYYSYTLGAWHIIVLNSNCTQIGGCEAGSAQEQWLRAELAANPSTCTLAYWHHPLFTSGKHGNAAAVRPLWQALYDAGADVVLTGHDHNYERFAPQDAYGRRDDARGMREFVVGSGGTTLRPFVTVQPNSESRNSTVWGVLKLTLHATSYDWECVPVAGQSFSDTGTASCVNSASGAPTATPAPTSTTVPINTPTPMPPSSPTPTNLLNNGGFEIDATGNTRPDAWSSSSKFTRSTAVAPHTGSYVGQFQATDNTGASITQRVAVRTGTAYTYTFRSWVNIPKQDDRTWNLQVQLTWKNANNTNVGSVVPIASFNQAQADGTWRLTTKSLAAPTGATAAVVKIKATSLNGSMYVDDFVFRPQ